MTDLLDASGLAYEIFSDIKANPTIENVQAGVAAFKAAGADYIIAIGGGSPHGYRQGHRHHHQQPRVRGRAQSGGRRAHQAAPACRSSPSPPPPAPPPRSRSTMSSPTWRTSASSSAWIRTTCPIVAVVDPEMMASMPKGLTAATGMDALTHAIEGYTTKAAWEMTDMFHLKAIELISKHLRGAVAGTTRKAARAWRWASTSRAWAFRTSAWASPTPWRTRLGAVYDTPHGVACAMIAADWSWSTTADAHRRELPRDRARHGREGRRCDDAGRVSRRRHRRRPQAVRRRGHPHQAGGASRKRTCPSWPSAPITTPAARQPARDQRSRPHRPLPQADVSKIKTPAAQERCRGFAFIRSPRSPRCGGAGGRRGCSRRR